MAHFASSLARPGVVSIRLIVDICPILLLNISTSTGSRLWSDRSAIKLIISALSFCVNMVLMWLPPYSGLYRLKLPVITTLVYRLCNSLPWIRLLIIFSLLESSSRFSFLVLLKYLSGMYTDTIISLLWPTCATTAVMSTESTCSYVAASSLDA